MGDAAVDLSLDDHRVDHGAEVVHGGIVDDLDLAGVGIDLDLADMRSRRKREVEGIVERVFLEPGLDTFGVVVRHVGRKGDLGNAHGLVGAGDGEVALPKLDIRFGGFQCMGGDLLALGDDLVDRLDDRGAADGDRARAVGAHAEGNAAGIAVHHLDVFDRHAELVRDHLGEGGFMALAVGMGAGKHGHAARGVEADTRRLVKTHPGAERADDRRRRDAAGFDIGREADAAQLAPALGLLAARLEARVIRQAQGRIKRGPIIPAIVFERHLGLIGEGVRRDEVAAAQFHQVDPRFARGVLDQAFHHEGGLGPAGAAHGVHGRGVGEHRLDLAIHGPRRVGALHQDAVKVSRHRRGEGREISPHVGDGADAQSQKSAVRVERQLGVGDVVASMAVGLEGFGALGRPFDRPADLARGPKAHRLLGIDEYLRSESAADVGRHDAELVLRRDLNEGREHQAVDVRVLAGDIEGKAVVARVVVADRRPRLDGVGQHPVVDDIQLGDVMGLGERLVGRRLVADLPIVTNVARRFRMHQRRTDLGRIGRGDDGRSLLVVDLQLLGRVLRLIQAVRDDHGHLVADVTHRILRQGGMGRCLVRLTVLAGDRPATDQAAQTIGGQMLAGEDRDHAGRGLGRVAVDRADPGVGVGRADEIGVRLARAVDVVGVVARSRQETEVLRAAHAGADSGLGHVTPPSSLGRRRGSP